MSETSLAISKFSDLANPTRFLALASRVIPWMAGITALCLAVGLYLSFATEGDYQQGETVRIMYIHVPSAWLAMMCYTVMSISAIGTLVWRHPLADVSAKAAAPLGAAFTLLALVTGSLWGKPMWGAYWVWDARLTSELVLLFLYAGVIGLNQAYADPRAGARACAWLALVGVVNVPIVHYSVTWWNSLHQGSSILSVEGMRNPKIAGAMLWPLLLSLAGFFLFFGAVWLRRMQNEVLSRERNARWAQDVVAA